MASAAVGRTAAEWIADGLAVDAQLAAAVARLFDENNTVPFIARYRRGATGALTPEQLRNALRLWNEAHAVQSRAATVTAQIDKQGGLTNGLRALISEARSLVELETIYAPYKVGGKPTLAARAKALGLEAAAQDVLFGRRPDFTSLVDAAVAGKSSIREVTTGIEHVIAERLVKDVKTQDFIRQITSDVPIRVRSVMAKATKDLDEKTKQNFENYFNFDQFAAAVQPHQIMALNRAEQRKVLRVQIVVPAEAQHRFCSFCRREMGACVQSAFVELFRRCSEDAFKRLVEPQICRGVRSSLTRQAELASVAIFAKNLRQLLLTPKLRDAPILGIDPGFRHGCKLALISPSADGWRRCWSDRPSRCRRRSS